MTTLRERLIDAPRRRQWALSGSSGGEPLPPVQDYLAEQRRQGRLPAATRPAGITVTHVRQARQLERWSQHRLAQHLTISRGWLGLMEEGRRPLHPRLLVWAAGVLRRHGRLP